MKKIFFVLSLMLSFTAIYALDATVTSVTGKAERLVGDNWVALEVGNKLEKGDVVQTGFKSELVLQIGSATVNLSALSRVTVEQLAEKKTEDGSVKDTTSLYVDTGTVRSAIKKTTDNRKVGYTVRNPVATASVRGTEFIFATKYRSAVTKTLEGSVAVWKTKNKEVEIAPDEEVVAEETETSENTDNATVETSAEETHAEEGTTEDSPSEETPKKNQNLTPKDISDDAPIGSFLVSKGQESQIEASGKTKKPKEKAKEKAKEVSAVVQSATENDSSTDSGAQTVTKKGNLDIKVIFED